MLRCPHCLTKLDGSAQFCDNCGRKLSDYDSTDSISVTVGKTSDNEVIIASPNVSSHHAVFRIENGRVMLEDLNSTNGTYVNGNKIFIANVTDRDLIMFGKGNYFDWNRLLPYLNPGVVPVQQNISQKDSSANKQNYLPPKTEEPKYVKQPYQSIQYKSQGSPSGLGNEVVWAIEMGKSYVTQAIITMMLYLFVIWIGGFIANLVYLSQANKTKQITGRSPSGYGCLISLLIVFGILPLVLFVLFYAAIMAAFA